MNSIFIWITLIVFSTIFFFSQEAQIVLGGVALFFLGMYMLESGVKGFSGGNLEKFLKKATNTTPKAMFTGFFTTAIVQSSSLTSLLAISFIGAGLINLGSGIGIIFGSNLGSTATSWLIAVFGLKLKISSYALSLAAFGIILNMGKSTSLKNLANILLGLALLFLAIGFMKEGFETIKDSIDLSQYAIGGIKGLLIFTLIGIFATVVMQSSAATMALVLTALATQQITYENGLALAIGANVGTTITAILGSIASNADGKRLALAHLVFNIITGIIALVFIQTFVFGVDTIANYFNITDLVLKLTIFHSLFNLVGIIFMIPFIGILERFLNRFVKEKRSKLGVPKFINKALSEDPTSYITALKSELDAMFKDSYVAVARSLNITKKDLTSNTDLEEIIQHPQKKINVDLKSFYSHRIKPLFNEIFELSTKAQTNMSQEEIKEIYHLKNCARSIAEILKDAKELHKNLERFYDSQNEDIKQEYNHIRLRLAKMIKKVDRIQKSPTNSMFLIKFTTLKRKLEEDDKDISSKVDRLIRDNKITSAMGTSLLNDSHYAYLIGANFIKVVVALYIYTNEDMLNIYQELNEEKEDRHGIV